MATISVLNTDAGLSAKTIVNAEDAQNITGLKAFNRSPNPPFTVQAASAVVTNLNADKLDGLDGPVGAIVGISDAQTLTNKTITAPTITTPSIDTIALTGGQIAFPAAQASAAGANTLDDYEEGSWTPTIIGSTSGVATYTSQTGYYVKIGQLVIANFNVVTAGINTLVGNTQLGGLPFTINALAAGYTPIGSIYWSTLAAGTYVTLITLALQNTTTASFYGATAAAASLAAAPVSIIGAATNLAGIIIYRASA